MRYLHTMVRIADIDQSLAPLDAGALRKGLRGLAG